MKIATSEQMRKIDQEASELYGIPGIILMENAGIKICRHIVESGKQNGRVCFICGKGNNGGDGFAAARHLSFTNKNIVIYLAGDFKDLKGDALVNYNIARKLGLCIKNIADTGSLEELAGDISSCSLLVDGLLGTGVKREVTGLYRDIIEIINRAALYVLSIDIPSGIDSDTGMILGIAVKAHKTVTLALPKIGLYTYPGAEHAGQVVVESISLPSELIERQNIGIGLLDRGEIAHLFKRRQGDTNKGTYGRAFIIGGSLSMMGAPVLCGLSALRCGTGIVEMGVPCCIQERVAQRLEEAIITGLIDNDGMVSCKALNNILEHLSRATSFAIGPGLSRSEGLLGLLQGILEESRIPGIIDADGLNILSENTSLLKKAVCTMVVTPHPGEMARLTGKDIKTIQQDRIGYARDFSQSFGVVTVLKGAHTVVASKEGEVFINTTGNPGMAKGGTGDILAGMIASFLAQGQSPFKAAKAGVYIHGLAGDMASCEIGEYGMKAGDLIDYIPRAIREVGV